MMRPALVRQNHWIDPGSTLDATIDFGVVFAAVAQVVAPISHEQTCATGTGRPVQLIAGLGEGNCMVIAAAFHSPPHSDSDSASGWRVDRDLWMPNAHMSSLLPSI